MLQHLSAPRGKSRSTRQGERYVRADLRPDTAKLRIGQSKSIEFVHTAQCRRRICTPAGQSRCDGNPLFDANVNTAIHTTLLQEKCRRAVGEISLVRLESRQINRQRDPRLLLGERQRIGECKRLHHRRDFVVAVRSQP